MLLEKITSKENLLLQRLNELGGGIPIYIWGAEAGAVNVKELLKRYNVSCDGMVVNREYYVALRKDVLCLEDVLENSGGKVALIVAFTGYNDRLLGDYKDKAVVLLYDCYGIERTLDYEWVLKKRDVLQRTYDWLEDNLSKETMVAFLNQKISCKFGYLSNVKSRYEYFEDSLIRLSENETFVDCGAYDGDTVMAFIEALQREGIEKYKEIISFEPNDENYEKLRLRKLENHICIKKGVLDFSGKTVFSGKGVAGKVISENKDGRGILVDTVDNTVGDRNITMIKMDIEGSELAALKGSKNTILRCHPKLAICIYHKKEDLYEIPEYIKKLSVDYKLYIRAYKDMAAGVILYAL